QARLHHRTDRPHGAVLPALAGDRRGGGARLADLRLRQRRGGPHRGGGDPRERHHLPPVAASPGRGDPGGPGVSATTNPAVPRAAAPALDVQRVRRDFPILGQTVHGKPLVYLDNAASAQKPRAVIAAEAAVYESYYSNIHRGVHSLSMRSTDAYE